MSEITPKEMLEDINERLILLKNRAASGRTTTAEMFRHEIETLEAIRDFIAKHSDPEMVLVPREVFLALSQLLNSTTDMCNPDGRFWNLDLSETRCASLRNAIENAKKIVQAAKEDKTWR